LGNWRFLLAECADELAVGAKVFNKGGEMKKLVNTLIWSAFLMATFLVFCGIALNTTGQGSEAAFLRHSSDSLASTGTITGTVTDESGNPIAGMGVGAGNYDSVVNCEGFGEFWAGTDADGSYGLDVPAGTYLVFINSHGEPGNHVPEAYSEVNSWSEIAATTPVTVAAGQTVTGVNFSLPAGFTVSGRLVDDQGQPVLGAGGNIQDPYQDIEFGCALGFGSSDTDGTFRINVPAGIYDLSFNGVTVRYAIVVTDTVDLGDVLFAEAPEEPRALEPGYIAEWFVAPGAFNMPQEVLLTPQGDLLVLAVRAGTLFRVADDGTVTPLATDVPAYAGDVDAQGNVYLYYMLGGIVTRVSPDGTANVVVQSPEIQSAYESGFGFGPDGNLYLALNLGGDTADLFQIAPTGEITRLAEAIRALDVLRTAPDGRFLARTRGEVYELSLDDYSLTLLAYIPGPKLVSAGGLALDDAGNIYVSTGSRSPGGQVYRMDSSGQATLVADIPVNGLSGIEWLPDTGEIVGGQLRQGALIAVGTDGTLREIVPGNGLVTPMGMAFSPNSELAVANDDGGMMALINPVGEVSWFFDYVSFTPPVPFVAFAPDGTLYASEGAPGFPERVVVVPPGETPRWFSDAAMPSGLAYHADSVVIVSETSAGRITQINPDKSTTVLAEGLDFPQALALDANGNLYAVTGPDDFVPDPVFTVPGHGDTIIGITPEGDLTAVAHLSWVSALAVEPSGDLFATVPGGVARISLDGMVSPFASGLQQAMGLAFDLTGNLYVSDARGNGIARISGFPHGTLSGTVTEATDAPIEGARVHVLSDRPIVAGQVVTTDAAGCYSLLAAPRTYTVTASAPGYVSQSQTNVLVEADETVTVDFSLTPFTKIYLPLITKNYQ
jgi:sugar lactone lactonase YvrE